MKKFFKKLLHDFSVSCYLANPQISKHYTTAEIIALFNEEV